jgi:hypothetical protein
MGFQKELKRYMNDLQTFDLDTFFHDDTFVDMLEYRKYLENNIQYMTPKERQELFYLDEIVLSYYYLYSNRVLTGYAQLSFKLLKEVAMISKIYVEVYEDSVA